MIEVFKTDITDTGRASEILEEIHSAFPDCSANFDLDDCDNILRVVCKSGTIDAEIFIEFLHSLNCDAEVLEDVVVPLPMFVMV